MSDLMPPDGELRGALRECQRGVRRLTDELAALRARCSWDERVDPLTAREIEEAFQVCWTDKHSATVREVVCRRAIITERP